MNNPVYIVETESKYPQFPYTEDSAIKDALKNLFLLWGKDPGNPFGDWVKEGDRVLIKPNWVRDFNPDGHGLESLISHSSLIKYILDFLARSMNGRGKIIIADAPLQNCNFKNLTRLNRITEVIEAAREDYPGLEIILEDWRLTVLQRHNWLSSWTAKEIQSSKKFDGNEPPEKYRLVDLGRGSFLEDIAEYSDLFRVTNYKCSLLTKHHRPGTHEYLVTRRISEVDLIINLPKMKTHIKAGLTGAMKNLVGINGHKEFLPHHIKGPYFKGGDNYCLPSAFREAYEDLYDEFWESFGEFPVLKRKWYSLRLKALWGLSRLFGREGVSAGSWSGNETIWRTVLDLNHILYFSEWSPKKVITIVDGIVAGEGEGPLSPTPRELGVIVGGENPAYVDAVLAKLMGYNISRIPTVYNAIYHRKSKFGGAPLEEFSPWMTDRKGESREVPFGELPNYSFKKPRYWQRAESRSGR